MEITDKDKKYIETGVNQWVTVFEREVKSFISRKYYDDAKSYLPKIKEIKEDIKNYLDLGVMKEGMSKFLLFQMNSLEQKIKELTMEESN